jgi:hypothetical protein
LEERRSVKAHLMRTNPKSGAIYSSASVIKNAVTSVWEAEVNAASDALDTMIYGRNICNEVKISYRATCRVLVDNEAAIHWLNGNNVSTTTKHVGARLYRIRHVGKEGWIGVEYIATEENVADIFTKSLPRGKFQVEGNSNGSFALGRIWKGGPRSVNRVIGRSSVEGSSEKHTSGKHNNSSR